MPLRSIKVPCVERTNLNKIQSGTWMDGTQPIYMDATGPAEIRQAALEQPFGARCCS
jgi:hypothetical protein